MIPPEALPDSNFLSSLQISAVFLLAGVVKGVVGLGLPTMSMGLLALVMAPADAAALLVVPSLVTNIWQLRPWGMLGPMLKRLGSMQLGVCFGTLAGAWAFGAPAGAWAVASLGVTLIGYAAWGLFGLEVTLQRPTERWAGPLIGAATGLVTAATGVFMIPAVPYLQALGLKRDELIQAMGVSFTVSTLALAGGLYLNSRYSSATLFGSILLLLPTMVGMAIGQHLRQKFSQAMFRKCFLASLLLLGAHMVGHEVLAY